MKATFKNDKREYEFDCTFEQECAVLEIVEKIISGELKQSDGARQLCDIVKDAAKSLPEKVSMAWVLFAARTISDMGAEGNEAEKNVESDS